MKYHASGLLQDTSMSHSPAERTRDQGINMCIHQSVNREQGNILIQPHASNEGCGEQRDITTDNKTSKQRPHDCEASPVIQRGDSPILITDKCHPAPCRTHHGRDLNSPTWMGTSWGRHRVEVHRASFYKHLGDTKTEH